MKVLFLDVDGVMNCDATTERFHGFLGIDPTKAELVKRILSETGATIVLSSTWRADAKFRAEVERHLGGIEHVTPILRRSRGAEVASWLRMHPEVTQWAALDDDTSFSKDQKVFQTTFDEGLTPEIASEVIAYFTT